MSYRGNMAAVALGAALLCGFLGYGVTIQPPGALDRAGRAVAGEWPHLALVFTASCWWQSLVSLGVLALVFAAVVPSWRPRVFFSVLTTIVAWQASDAVKNIFGRDRPSYWLLHHETSASYPSGHAMFAVVVYGLWSYYVATSSLPVTPRRVLAALIALWGVAVIWSRLALGAHYITDLIGGVLFAIAMLAAATAIAPNATRPRSAATAGAGAQTA
jgi:undecaprenyl-diphosphatase